MYSAWEALSHLDGHTLYIYNAGKFSGSRSEIRLYHTTIPSSDFDSINFVIPDSITISTRFPLLDFRVNGNYAAFLLWEKLLIYRRVPTGNELRYVFTLPHRYDHLSNIHGNSLTLMESQFIDPNQDPIPSRICSVDLAEGEVGPEKPFPLPEGIYFTIAQPRNLATFKNTQLVVASAPRYHVTVYDSNLAPVAHLDRRPSDWTALDSSKWNPGFGSVRHLVARSIFTWLDPLNDNYSTIKRVDFLDSATLLVSWLQCQTHGSGPLRGGRMTRYDIWQKREGRWVIRDSDMTEGDSVFYRTHLLGQIMPPAWNYTSDASHLIGVTDLLIKRGEPNSDVVDRTLEYEKTHDPIYSVYVLRFEANE
ncbi:MAG: hypothetical protein ACRDF4_00955 [Rhabdochlamydiaceae bacterium]